MPSLAVEGPLWAFYSRAASDLGVDKEVARIVRAQFGARRSAEFRRLLRTVEAPVANLLLGEGPRRFSHRSPMDRARYLASWRDSPIPVKRAGFQALKRLTCSLFYALPDASGQNPNWTAIGYSSSFPSPPPDPTPDPTIVPLSPETDLELSAHVCVVGSGAGGSVVAHDLQRAGYSVVVLEAGAYNTGPSVTSSEYGMTGRVSEEAGTLATDDLSFQLLAGRGAGGGTFVNWMTCLRPPLPVLREWESAYGVLGLTSGEFARDVDSVWTDLEVNDRESQRNANNDALWRGALALGYREGSDFQTLARNAVGCRERCDFCGFGCVYECRRSTVLNYLPQAHRAGARFLFRTTAEELEVAGHRVQAVRARYQSGSGAAREIRVKCRVAVLSAGAIGTPRLLLRSGVRDRAVGTGLRLHPTTAVSGEMATAVRAWRGPPQSVAVTRFMDWEGSGHGFWMEAAPAHPGLFALATPWADGASHKRWMAERFARSTSTIVLLRERSRGTVRLDAHGDARIRYALNAQDRAGLQRGIQETGRILAAAGARRLVTLHSPPIEAAAEGDRMSPEEFDRFLQAVGRRSLGPNRCLMFSAHLMGSCPMGADGRGSAVRPTGELWSLENAFVADGSVFPTSPGVNPMITIMALARRTARSVIRRLRDGDR